MVWIVLGEEKGRVKLVSKNEVSGILPKGSYLTVDNNTSKHIVRVDGTTQTEPFQPSPMIVDMDLSPLKQDQKCKNIIYAFRVYDITNRDDGLIDFIRPQTLARRSNQEEINMALGNIQEGPEVFIATVHSAQNQLLTDEEGKMMTAKLPVDMFYHQTLICGKTGRGKTVAIKYLAQYFVEELGGCVLAVNVKDVDLLRLDQASKTNKKDILKEWSMLKKNPHGVMNFEVYYPANTTIEHGLGVTQDRCHRITLDVSEIEPDALTGLLHGVTDIGAQNLPDIFRFWQERQKSEGNNESFTFDNFINYFRNASETREFDTINSRGNPSLVKLHPSTYDNIIRNLNYASDFFDNENSQVLTEEDILFSGKMSVINVTGNKGIKFGSILLRDLLRRIVAAKESGNSDVPILIIIDEVHQFYDTESSEAALGDLARICRTGRSKKMGIIFSSQNPSDIPKGIDTVINTKIFFKSDASVARSQGISVSMEEMESLKTGYAVASIHDLWQLKILKFPLALAGVFSDE